MRWEFSEIRMNLFLHTKFKNILAYIHIRTELLHELEQVNNILNSMVSGYTKGSLSRNNFLIDYLTAMDTICAKEDTNE